MKRYKKDSFDWYKKVIEIYFKNSLKHMKKTASQLD